MPTYKAPLRDIQFVINEVLDTEALYQSLPGYEEATPDLMHAIIEEGAKFAENVLSPLNQSGDEEGCQWSEEGVTTPEGFKEAYQQYVENGWPALSADAEYGGQGMPNMLGIVINELAGTANWSWLMYPGLSHGCIKTLEAHGSHGTEGDLPAEPRERQVDGHDVPHGVALRLRPGAAAHQGGAPGRW
jgi:alkylation response protein AidB-like acyl-CoA dehydrogenase